FNSPPPDPNPPGVLGIHVTGLDPKHAYHGTKSGSRRVFREAGVDLPEGSEDLRDEHDVERAIHELREKRPGAKKVVIKLNESFSGEGNAVVRLPPEPSAELKPALDRLELA